MANTHYAHKVHYLLSEANSILISREQCTYAVFCFQIFGKLSASKAEWICIVLRKKHSRVVLFIV